MNSSSPAVTSGLKRNARASGARTQAVSHSIHAGATSGTRVVPVNFFSAVAIPFMD